VHCAATPCLSPSSTRGIASQLSARPASLPAPEGSLALYAKQIGVLRSGRTVPAALAGTREARALVPLPSWLAALLTDGLAVMCAQSAEHQAFEAAARAMDDVEFFQTGSTDVAKAAGLSAQGIAFVGAFEGEPQKATYSGPLKEKDAIREFVKAEKVCFAESRLPRGVRPSDGLVWPARGARTNSVSGESATLPVSVCKGHAHQLLTYLTDAHELQVPPYVIFTEENQDLIFNSGIPLNVSRWAFAANCVLPGLWAFALDPPGSCSRRNMSTSP